MKGYYTRMSLLWLRRIVAVAAAVFLKAVVAFHKSHHFSSNSSVFSCYVVTKELIGYPIKMKEEFFKQQQQKMNAIIVSRRRI